jgi:predicted ATPase/DNA-binding CsgD family transcriptional regulator
MTADKVPRLGNLPAEPNSFIGRERDLGDLTLLLGSVRALTLCGPGGIGKTRLATRLGWQLATEFPDGVWLVEFADSADPALAARRIAAVLGISEEPDRPASATLADALRSRKLLLILDTCEHVVSAIADLVHDLIAACPLIRLVATSREPLRVRGETVWRVPPLALPSAAQAGPAAQEAVRLFVDRAAAVRPGFVLTAENSAQIVQLCRTLDGVPLAIELAAARIRALSVEQIAARLDDRFRLLASGDRTAPPRQQTLLAAVDWSFDLLTPAEQVLLRRLSVFASWNLEMAEQVCADDQIPEYAILDLLAALIDKSLVGLEDEVAGDARYRLLDTIREYAAVQLAAAGEREEFRRRHADYILELAERVVGQAFVRGAMPWTDQIRYYHRIAAERPNCRAALAWCLETADAGKGLRLCSALRSPWVVHGDVTEGLGWFGRFLALDEPVPAAVRARALMLSAELAFEHQDYRQAAATARAAVALGPASAPPAGSAPGDAARAQHYCQAGALRILALISLREGDGPAALGHADAAVAEARACGDEWEEGLALAAKAAILARSGQLASAQTAYEVALELLTDNNGWGVAHALYGFGSLARARRDNAAALQHFGNALELFRQIDARTEIARCLAGIGWVALASLDVKTAAASLAESLELSEETGQRLGIARGLEAFAALAVVRDDNAAAIRLEGAATALREVVGPVRSPGAQARLDGLLQSAHHRLGAGLAAGLMAEGRRLSMHEAVRYAVSTADGLAAGPGAGGAEALPPPSPGEPALPASPLTARELQISLLIARGLSNRGIAEELVISPATAARHVANILAKLGLSSRAQIAAWTADHGGENGGPAARP